MSDLHQAESASQVSYDNPNYTTVQEKGMYNPPPSYYDRSKNQVPTAAQQYVTQPGVLAVNGDASTHVPDYRVLVLISMFFNLLFEILSTYYAFNALDLKNQGHTLLAVSQAKTSRTFAIVALVMGLLNIVALVIILPIMLNNIQKLQTDLETVSSVDDTSFSESTISVTTYALALL